MRAATSLMPPNEWKAIYARDTDAMRTLGEAVARRRRVPWASRRRTSSSPNSSPLMADRPIIMALANPVTRRSPRSWSAKSIRPDAIIATGRSDYPEPDQQRALLSRSSSVAPSTCARPTINEAMKIAAVEATAELARVEASDVVAAAYGGAAPVFGPDYIIPKPFDPRLILQIAPAVARAAMASGAATRPIDDFDAYRRDLEKFVFRSGQLMRPVFEAAKKDKRRIVYAEGADERVLRAVQTLVDDGVAEPILLGERDEIVRKARAMGLRLKFGDTAQILDPERDRDVFDPLAQGYQRLVGRRGVPPDAAARRLLRRPTVAASMLLHAGHADAAICGGTGDWWRHMTYLMPIIPRRPEVGRIYALSAMITGAGNLFVCDTHVNVDPTAEQVAEMTILAADEVRDFGVAPKVALMSHSSFGASNSDSARKMRRALALVRERAPTLEVDGEMHPDAALVPALRERMVRDSRLEGVANLLVMPNLDAANISFNLLKAGAEGLPIGPILLGMCKPIHVLVPTVTARAVVNVSAVAARQAQREAERPAYRADLSG